jgi:hypothetical protein
MAPVGVEADPRSHHSRFSLSGSLYGGAREKDRRKVEGSGGGQTAVRDLLTTILTIILCWLLSEVFWRRPPAAVPPGIGLIPPAAFSYFSLSLPVIGTERQKEEIRASPVAGRIAARGTT